MLCKGETLGGGRQIKTTGITAQLLMGRQAYQESYVQDTQDARALGLPGRVSAGDFTNLKSLDGMPGKSAKSLLVVRGDSE